MLILVHKMMMKKGTIIIKKKIKKIVINTDITMMIILHKIELKINSIEIRRILMIKKVEILRFQITILDRFMEIILSKINLKQVNGKIMIKNSNFHQILMIKREKKYDRLMKKSIKKKNMIKNLKEKRQIGMKENQKMEDNLNQVWNLVKRE